jgi:hypothetical protein
MSTLNKLTAAGAHSSTPPGPSSRANKDAALPALFAATIGGAGSPPSQDRGRGATCLMPIMWGEETRCGSDRRASRTAHLSRETAKLQLLHLWDREDSFCSNVQTVAHTVLPLPRHAWSEIAASSTQKVPQKKMEKLKAKNSQEKRCRLRVPNTYPVKEMVNTNGFWNCLWQWNVSSRWSYQWTKRT